MSFKIIAIEPLASCHTQHSKNLEKEIPYIFYNNYEFTKLVDGHEIIKLVSEDFDLYSKEDRVKINISAIVGKNGSGKSTLIELLIKTINNLFYEYRKTVKYNFHQVGIVKGIEANIFYKTSIGLFKLYVFSDRDTESTHYKVYQYTFDNIAKVFKDANEITASFNLTDFFYTEVINYSLYSYNSEQEGDWIKHIFHKNDAYQTPVVLNPWREHGIININKENDLIYQRLLSNLLRYDSSEKLNLNLGDNLEAKFLLLRLSDSSYYENKAIEDFGVDLSEFDTNYRDEILDILLINFYKRRPVIDIERGVLELSKLYILYKLISICHKYEEYKNGKYYDDNTKRFNLEELVIRLNKDNSHIIFKLRQMLNYLVYKHIEFDTAIVINKISTKQIATEIKKVSDVKKYSIINLLPPPIFRTDIELASLKSNEENIKFSMLSSGEKQQVYSSSSIYYHILNLDSVKKSTDNNKKSYRYINVILEEIELYFHPEYQRQFINSLLRGIKNLNLENIEGINLIFVSHSPFILSDIPHTNILYLMTNENGYSSTSIKKIKKSFASNIHHLLADNFFFENNIHIGEFARSKITEIIAFLEGNEKSSENEINYYYNLIELIDEPILKDKLLDKLLLKFPKFQDEKNINKKEMMVKAFAEQMGIKINIDNT